MLLPLFLNGFSHWGIGQRQTESLGLSFQNDSFAHYSHQNIEKQVKI